MANILQQIFQAISGEDPNQPAPQVVQSPPRVQPMAPVAQNVPIPTPAPRPNLPNGTFAPNRSQPYTLPNPGPIPQQRAPYMPAPIQQPAPQMQQPLVQTAQADPRTNPLMALFQAGQDGQPSPIGELIRSFGAGMAKIDPRNDDPFSTFGAAASGAGGYHQAMADAQYAKAQDAKKFDYATGQDALKFNYAAGQDAQQNARANQELELRRAADARAAKSSSLADQKTARELDIMAKNNGVDPSLMLKIENMAQDAGNAAAKADFNGSMDPQARKKIVDDTRNELLQRFGTSQPTSLSEPSLTDGGLSEVTATGPNGEKLVLRNGQLVPAK